MKEEVKEEKETQEKVKHIKCPCCNSTVVYDVDKIGNMYCSICGAKSK